MQECEGLEALVLGDDMADFNWNALDDDAMLTRMYILAKQKVGISTESAIWRALCNNYNPTFDAFYVLPSTYDSYLYDDAYTGSSWQRTNNISKADFDDDASFRFFASHAAATMDDLAHVYSVKDWTYSHTDVKDLTPLGYTAIDSLHAADMQKLTQLEQVMLPVTLTTIEKDAFAQSPNLRYVDMMMVNNDLTAELKQHGLADIGIDSLQTLVYMPSSYGTSNGTNIVVSSTDDNDNFTLSCKTFRLVDGKDYCVPYPFQAASVQNSRVLPTVGSLYTVCLPYPMAVPTGAKAYQMSDRSGDELVFTEVKGGEMQALKPYLVKVVTGGNISLDADGTKTIPASKGLTPDDDGRDGNYGYIMRGSLQNISNADAHQMGAYILQADNRWYPVPDGIPVASILPIRAYLLASAGTANARPMNMRLYDNTTTAVETIRTIDADGTERLYDLSGRQLPTSSPPHLPNKIVIKNGKKIVMK